MNLIVVPVLIGGGCCVAMVIIGATLVQMYQFFHRVARRIYCFFADPHNDDVFWVIILVILGLILVWLMSWVPVTG